MKIVSSLSVLKELVPYWETVSILASYPVSLQDCFSDSNLLSSSFEPYKARIAKFQAVETGGRG